MWIMQQFSEQEATYQITVVFTMHGPLDQRALEAAVYELADRHEPLRARVDLTRGVPEQVVMEDWSAFLVVDLSHLAGRAALEAESAEIDAASASGVDLLTEAALRVRLLKFSEHRHVLILCVHHMMADMWSMDVVGRDLTEFYNARVEGRSPRLPALETTYGEYTSAEEQAARSSSEEARSSVDYWASVLADAPARMMLPWDRKHTGTRGASAVEGLSCARKTLTGLRSCAARNRTTLFSVLLAAFHCYLHRITSHEITTVGTFVAVRHRSELEDLVGLLFDEVPVVVRPRPDTTFSDVVASVRSQLVNALQHPGDGVAEAARMASGSSARMAPPFNVTMQMYQRSPGRLGFKGIQAEQHRVFVGAKYDAMLYAAVSDAGLDLWFNYNSALLDRDTVSRLLRGFNHILGQVAAGNDGLIGDLEVVAPMERAKLMQTSLGPVADYPEEADIDELFRKSVRSYPHRTAVRWSTRAEGTATLTYSELDAVIQNMSDHLHQRGVGRGDVVGVLAERNGLLVAAYLAVLRVGAAVALVDVDAPPDYVRASLGEAGADRVLVDLPAQRRHSLEGFHCIPLREALSPPDGGSLFVPSALGSETPAFVVRTSGTTGPSRAVVLAHRGVVNQVFHRQTIFDVGPDSVVALSLSVAFSALPMQLLVPLLSGATLAVCDSATARNTEALFEFADDLEVTILEVTPSQLAALVASRSSPQMTTPQRLRHLVTAGEKLPRALANDVIRRFPHVLLTTTWGQSEASGIMCSGVVTADGESVEVSEGFPSSNNRVYVLDDRMRPVPFGVEGNAYFAGPSVALGHVGTAQGGTQIEGDPWVPGERMVNTGDRVIRRPDGSIVVRGRLDSVVKVRGNRVDLQDVAAALKEHPNIGDAHVLAHDHPAGELELWAYVQAEPSLELGDIRKFLRRRLPDFMQPRVLLPVTLFPRTANGKLDLRALRAIAPAATGADRAEPPTALEQQLAREWERILGVPVDHDSDFFELGGHSLKAMGLCAAVSNATGRMVPVHIVFEHPVLRDFAAAVTECSDDNTTIPVESHGNDA